MAAHKDEAPSVKTIDATLRNNGDQGAGRAEEIGWADFARDCRRSSVEEFEFAKSRGSVQAWRKTEAALFYAGGALP